MNDIAIRVEGLGKEYYIGRKQEKYKSLREAATQAFVSPFRRAGKLLRGQATGAAELDEKLWALKDISFEIKRGEILGVIGPNGAGKSTLLKILARITEPTEGHADIKGRVSSLLEVGTGFHQELTGRENIYLNGAILGMKKTEIDDRFDEIVAFAEIEKFIDTPVKHYSSGMYLRLAFAVAAHLEPEILIVDEVLAVGDARFQRKCIDKMQDAGQRGRTILFVSHNMQAITRLCERAILLDGGRLQLDDHSHKVVSMHLNSELGTTPMREWSELAKAPGNDVVRLCSVRVRTEDGRITDTVDIRRPVAIEMEYEVLKPGYVFHPHFSLRNQTGVLLFTAQDIDPNWRGRTRSLGRYVSTGWIPGNFLNEGTMFVTPLIRTLNLKTLPIYEPDAVAFQVIDSNGSDTARGDYPDPIPGVVRPLLNWTTLFTPNAR